MPNALSDYRPDFANVRAHGADIAAGATFGGASTGFAALRNGAAIPSNVLAGAGYGAIVPLLLAMFPKKPQIAGMANAALLGPVGAPGVIGNALEMMGLATPSPQNIRQTRDLPSSD